MPSYYAVVGGLRLPGRLSGHPALDFCNTWAGWDGHAAKDYLESYDHLAVWAGFVGLLPSDRVTVLRRQAGRREQAAAAVLARARDLRGGLYDVLGGGTSPQAFDLVAEEVHAAATKRRLRRADQIIECEFEPESGLAAPVLAVAWSAGDLLTSSSLAQVRACPGTGCGWLFLDRRGRRRWCTMATCGNREKVRRFATRQRAHAVVDGTGSGGQR